MIGHEFYWGLIPLRNEEYKELLEKAELWDDYKQILQDLTTENQEQYEQLEAIREFVLIRRDDIEKDMENFGMLKTVLNYFLEKAED